MEFDLKFDYVKEDKRFNPDQYREIVKKYDKMLVDGTGLGHEFLGWMHYASSISQDFIDAINKKARYFRDNFDTFVICGIGGSYLGSRAVIEAINGIYSQDKMKIIYLGQTLDSNYTTQVIDYLKYQLTYKLFIYNIRIRWDKL